RKRRVCETRVQCVRLVTLVVQRYARWSFRRRALCSRFRRQSPKDTRMKYLHTMVRVTDVDKSLAFYRDLLGLKEVRRNVSEKGRYTLIFLAAPGQEETP